MAATATAARAPIDGKATADVDDGWNLPTDVFVEILLLLPPTKRWRLRIVCRYWRDVIHERTPAPERRSQPMALVFFQNYIGRRKVSASAFVIDDPAQGRGSELWRTEPAKLWKCVDSFDTMMVGTCNGLLCLCDNTRPGGAASLLNPVTGEALAPGSAQWVWWGMLMSSGWHEAYSFAYEPMTEQYKVVHLPCYLDWSGRELPAQAKRGYGWYLAEVHGRLGLVSSSDCWVTPEKIDVRALGGGRDRQGWSRRYRVQLNDGMERWFASPLFAHGDYVLTQGEHEVFEHRPRNSDGRWSSDEVRSVRISEKTPGLAVSGVFGGSVCGVFAYIKTKEPLSAYNSQAS
ncbi:hypothetical protein BAE44_0016858 [Dichanthelium oligosanthes]|uniref:F-box domain-containing protein n=1 Tax=Dichanthelium oligosanthes TaxID=888268 RepID=A0A1E5VAS8_9POAL|nr:hypothetical protein BAE44_0016858 [Dichanthelium oligosanthes]